MCFAEGVIFMANISNSTNGTLISGSSSADTLKNWGANVTIDAAAGNDTIYNGGDNASKTIAFTVNSVASAITLKDFTATTFNVNGDSYQISGSKLVKK